MAHVLRREAPRRLRRAVRAALVLGLGVGTFGVAGTRPAISVTINERPVGAFDRASIDHAMSLAGVRVRDGRLVSAVEARVLEPSHRPARIWVNGRPADRSTPLGDGDRVTAAHGPDAREEVVREPIVVPAGLPEVEHRLWHPGRDGIDEVARGSRSGEVLFRTSVLPVIPAAPEEAPVVALTFDDGPDPRWTPPIIENLKREGIKATFCVVGRQARKYPELIQLIVSEGHTLCDHSETHPVGLSRLSRGEIDQQVGSPAFFLRSLTGAEPGFFRAPGGSINDLVIGAARARDMRVLAWSVDPRDFEGPPPGEIQRRVMDRVKPGSVILLHDGGGIRSGTVAALPGLITRLRAAGYGFRTP